MLRYSQANRNRDWPFGLTFPQPCLLRLCLICPLVIPHRVIIVSSAVLAVAATLSSSELLLRSAESHRSLVVLLQLRIFALEPDMPFKLN